MCLCCGNKELSVFAYRVLTDVLGAGDINDIRSSQMRLLFLELMERIINWINLCLKHSTAGVILKSFLIYSFFSLFFSFFSSHKFYLHINICSSSRLPSSLLNFLCTLSHYSIISSTINGRRIPLHLSLLSESRCSVPGYDAHSLDLMPK